MTEDQDAIRDLAALPVPLAGALQETGDPWEPYRLIDAGGETVAAAAEFFRDLQAARILPRQPLHQRADLVRDRRTSRRIRIGPLLADQASVPGQQSARRYELVQPQASRQQPCQGGEYGTVSLVRLRAGDLPPQHRDLVAEDQDLHVLGGVAARQEGQPAEHTDYE